MLSCKAINAIAKRVTELSAGDTAKAEVYLLDNHSEETTQLVLQAMLATRNRKHTSKQRRSTKIVRTYMKGK